MAAFRVGLARTALSPRRRCRDSLALRCPAEAGAAVVAAADGAALAGEDRGLHAARNMRSIRRLCACLPCSDQCTAFAPYRSLARTGRSESVRALDDLVSTLTIPKRARRTATYIAAQKLALVLPGGRPAPYASWASSHSLHRVRKLSDCVDASLFVVFT